MKDLHHSCQGESHILADKVCQDTSYSATHDGVSVAIVSDGHGGARYFRSDVGSKLAVRATRDCVEAFVSAVDKRLFCGKPFTRKQATHSEAQAKILTKDTDADKAFRQLFYSIIFTWRRKIENHAKEHPLTPAECAQVKPEYQAEFEHSVQLISSTQHVEPEYQAEFEQGLGIEQTYGCTLMCYVSTPHYWFAFHIGDGKCIAFDTKGQWSEPIPWDDRCFLNKTTSLCDSTAIDEFRYCYGGDGTHPLAVCLGSDGIDDSFGKTENMVNFYIQLLKLIANEGLERAQQSVEETLPELSRIGSKDDMSVACVYDDALLPKCVDSLIHWQKTEVNEAIYAIYCRILALREKLAKYEEKKPTAQKDLIDCEYARKSLDKSFEEKRRLVEKWTRFCKELYKDDFIEYKDYCKDQVGLGEEQTESIVDEKVKKMDKVDTQTEDAGEVVSPTSEVVPPTAEVASEMVKLASGVEAISPDVETVAPEAENIVSEKIENAKSEAEKID